MRKLIFSLIVVVCVVGCLGPRYQEPYKLREKVSAIASAKADYVLYENLHGSTYWVPLQDVTRTRIREFFIEIEKNDRLTGARSKKITINLMSMQSVKVASPPGFMGITVNFGFWSAPDGFYLIELETAKIQKVQCNRSFIGVGKWEAVDARTLRRTSDQGVFEFTPEGARQVASARRAEGVKP